MNVNGTQKTHWELTIKNGAAAPASVTVENPSTSETVVWNNELAANAWLRFRSETQRADVSTDSGTSWTKTNTNMTGIIPQLQGGEDNAVKITGPTTGTFEYDYTAKGV